MRKRFFLLLFVLSSVLTATVAQTTADSLALVSADWQVTPLQKGILCRQATFASLYGVPQEISIFEISPKHHRLDILIHNPKEETSVAARRSGAIAAINGSYFDMKKGNSVCYLRKDGVVVDTTAAGGVLTTVSNGAVLIKKDKLQILPWSKEDEKTCRLKRGSLLASSPLMLLAGKARDLSACNPGFVNTKHPRSAVALTKEGKILFIVVDGRRKGKSEGISIPELTHLLRVLGCRDALNLDGGGSSTLWNASLPGKGIANTPSGNAERKVANSLCVYE
jgi:exopolysaccharide biosynthesis protein